MKPLLYIITGWECSRVDWVLCSSWHVLQTRVGHNGRLC